MPKESGPRCRMRPSIFRSVGSSSLRPLKSTMPAIPHKKDSKKRVCWVAWVNWVKECINNADIRCSKLSKTQYLEISHPSTMLRSYGAGRHTQTRKGQTKNICISPASPRKAGLRSSTQRSQRKDGSWLDCLTWSR